MKVYRVYNEKQLRYALDQTHERTVTFGAPVIQVTSHRDIVIRHGDVKIMNTLGMPVTIVGAGLVVKKCKNVTLLNIHIRRGATGFSAPRHKKDKSGIGEALTVHRGKNVLIENCTFGWGTDETVTVSESKQVVFLRCIVAHPLDAPRDANGDLLHAQSPHGYGMLVRASSEVYIEGCLFAHCRKRSPSVSPDGKVRLRVAVRNCIVYNWGEHGINFNAGGSDKQHKRSARYTVEGNMFLPGKNTTGPAINIEKPHKNRTLKAYVADNEMRGGHPVSYVEEQRKNKGKLKVSSAYGMDSYDPFVAFDLGKDKLLDRVGAMPRDLYAQIVVNGVSAGTGSFINHEGELEV